MRFRGRQEEGIRGGPIHVTTVAVISLWCVCQCVLVQMSMCVHCVCTHPTVISLLVSPVHLSASIQSDLQLHGFCSNTLHTDAHALFLNTYRQTNWSVFDTHINENTQINTFRCISAVISTSDVFISFLNTCTPH